MQLFKKKTYGIMTAKDLQTAKGRGLYLSLIIFGFLVVFVSVAPPLWVMLSSMKDIKELFAIPATIIPKTFHPEKIWETWNKLNFTRYYVNSAVMVTGSIASALVFNGLIAYVISILKPKGSKIAFYLVLWTLMIPNIIGLVPLFKNIVFLNLTNSFLPLWLSFGANAFFVMLFKSFFDTIPKSLMEAARLDGCSDLGIFFRVVLPLSGAINIVIIIFSFNAAWSEFLLSYLVLKDQNLFTVMVKLFRINEVGGLPKDYQLMATSFAILPPIVMFIFFQKWLTQGITLTGIKE